MQMRERQMQLDEDPMNLSAEQFKQVLNDTLLRQGKLPETATLHDYYMALAHLVHDRLLKRWLITTKTHATQNVKNIAYLSAEFLAGTYLDNALLNLGLEQSVRQAMQNMGLDLETVLQQENELGLGNGELGRLAVCYLDSLATLGIPAIGYGIRYEFGCFNQEIRDGWQVELVHKCSLYSNPWEIPHPEWAVDVKFGGYTEVYTDDQGQYRVRWIPEYVIRGIPFDTLIPGYQSDRVNAMRLWVAEAVGSFDDIATDVEGFVDAVNAKAAVETISKILYPHEDRMQHRELRLQQEFFLVSCALQDVIRLHRSEGNALETLPERFAMQLNDTYSAIAIVELMRLLIDEHGMIWEDAWQISQSTFAYTNHTLFPEALEQWSVELFSGLFPRHLEIIYEMNDRLLSQVRLQSPNEQGRIERMSLINEQEERSIRMVNLACVGSHSINGVTLLQTEFLKYDILKDFYDVYPGKFSSQTNGVSPRRFMVLSNPRLANLITRKIGENWIKNLNELKKLEVLIEDPEFCNEWHQLKQAVKQDLAAYISEHYHVAVDVNSLFDVQTKYIHEYRRQHLNVFHIITLYNRIKANPDIEITPRTFIFAGKASPDCSMARLVIKFINSVADVVNVDPDVRGRIKVIFLQGFNVKLAQRIYPAADLSEQISVAGKEASGTSGMKFAMNGALTIGTLDGANLEILEQVGEENFFRFGLTAEDVYVLKASGYNPWHFYQNNHELREVVDRIASGYFANGNANLFKPMIDSVLGRDEYLLLVDYPFYIACQDQISQIYRDRDRWTRMSILNVARIGKFSSDRAIQDYWQIWNARSVPIESMPPEMVYR
ncbi:MAG: glycogen/starch/alpha-glucan phosphorylase [Cyanobacteria bacterium CRU_2_1]|nr:glycogen/starch/alpha-glucan phosphorylase [Cyanobacteria bacterium CRU_2_1]